MLLKLLAAPITAPLAGFRFCLDQLIEMAENEVNDEEPVREALLLLTLRLEEGDIDDAEYAAEEAVLLRRLRDIRAAKAQRGGEQATISADAPVVISMVGAALTVEVSADIPTSERPRA